MSKRVTVIFSDEEYRQVKEIVGLVPMSAWIRALALYKSLPVAKATDEIEASARVVQSKMEKPSKPVDTSICQHGFYKSACPRCR